MLRSSQRSQQRDMTRARLLQATIDALIETGYAGATMAEVQHRTGLSRGAVLHHFPSKTEMFTAAINQIAETQIARLRYRTSTISPGPERTMVALRALADTFLFPDFLAALELWVGARTDSELHAAVVAHERTVGRALRPVCAELFGRELAERPGFAAAIDLTLQVLRGLALTGILRKDGEHDDALVALWASVFPAAVGAPASAPS